VAIGIVKVDRGRRNEAENRRGRGALLEEVAELDPTLLQSGDEGRKLLQSYLERKVLGSDMSAGTLPEAEQGAASPTDPEQCEAPSASRMGINPRPIYLALYRQLQSENRCVELQRAIEVRDVYVGLKQAVHIGLTSSRRSPGVT
jgi:hypothetical protein